MFTRATSGRIVRITLGGRPEKRDLLRRILAESGSVMLMTIDPAGVLTAFVADHEEEIDLVSSMFASGMYPLETMEQGIPAEGTYHAI